MVNKNQQLQEVELFISYCVYRNDNDAPQDFKEEFSTRKEARRYIKELPYMSEKILVCASAEIGGGACEFAYGETRAKAIRQLNKYLKEYGYKAVDLWKK